MKTPDAYEPDILRGVTVKELVIPVKVEEDRHSVLSTDDAGYAAELMGKHNTDVLTVKDESGVVLGMITARALLNYYSRQRQKEHLYESPARTRRMLVQGRKLLRTYKN